MQEYKVYFFVDFCRPKVLYYDCRNFLRGQTRDMAEPAPVDIGKLIDGFRGAISAWGNSLGLVLLVLGAIAFGLSRVGPAEMRARMSTYSMGLFIGGTIVLLGINLAPMLARLLSGQTG